MSFKKSMAGSLIILLCFFIVLSSGLHCEPWFTLDETSRPVYPRKHSPGLPLSYGQVGEDGLVWYSGLNGTLEALYISPDNPQEILSYTPEAENVEFTEGLLGKALYVPETEEDISITFREFNAFTPDERGSLVMWVRSDEPIFGGRRIDGVLHTVGFEIWSSGASALRHTVWTPPHLALQYRTDRWLTHPTNPYYVQALTNGFLGWNMFAYTWDTGAIKFYANGILVGEYPIPAGTFAWNHLGIGRRGLQAGRSYDEIAFYNRILSQSEIKSQYNALLNAMEEHTVSVPPSREPVDIDGTISPDEWDDASIVQGLLQGTPFGDAGTGNLSEPQARLMLKYDDDNLYIACSSPLPREVWDARILTTNMSGMLNVEAENGMLIDPSMEDAFEILISDPSCPEEIVYCLLVNGNNVVNGGIVNGRSADIFPGMEPGLDFGWTIATGLATGDEEGEWNLELVIPFESIGIVPHPGQLLNFNITRHWNLIKRGSESWQWGRRKQEPIELSRGHAGGRTEGVISLQEHIPFGIIKLAGQQHPMVSITSVGDLMDGNIDFRAEAFNPGARPVDIDFYLRNNPVYTGDYEAAFVIKSETITVPPGERVEFVHSRQIDGYDTNMLVFEARKGDSHLLKNIWHFVREEALDVYIKKFPTAGKVAVLINCGLLAEYTPSQLKARLAMEDEAGQVMAEALSGNFTSYAEMVMLDISGLAPGSYTLCIDILAEGQTVAVERQSYAHNPLPEWLGNEDGWNFDTVPGILFSAVEREGDTLKAWHRTYEFNGRLLPRQITTQGWELLRAPVRLILTLDDGRIIDASDKDSPISWDDAPSVTVARQVDGVLQEVEKTMSPDLRREGSSAFTSGGVTVENHFWFEYDGLLWNRIKVRSDEDLVIREMAIEVEMTAFFSRDMMPGNVIPPEGSDRILSHIGNGYGGLQPIVRTAPAGDITAHIKPGEAGASYRITLVDSPMPISELNDLEFSLQATPVKARYPEYRKHVWYLEGSRTFFDIGGFYPAGQVCVPAPDGFYSNLTIDTDVTPVEELGRFARFAEYEPRPVIYRAPYWLTGINVTVPEASDFKDEWLASPRGDEKIAPGASRISPAYNALSTRDYFLWRYARLMDEVPFGSMYFDGEVRGGFAHPALHSAPGTKHHPELGAREFKQRLYHLVKLNFPDGIMFDHSRPVDMAIKSFKDFEIEGEQDWPSHYEGMRDFRRIMPLDKYRGKYMGLQYGWIGNWLLKLNRFPVDRQRKLGIQRSIAEHAQSIKLLHDSSQHLWRYMSCEEYNERLRRVLIEHDWGSGYLMMPYWDQHVAQLPEDMYASFYIRPSKDTPAPETFDTAGYYLRTMQGSEAEKVICIFANESDFEGEARVELDWKRLGFESIEGLSVQNAVHRLRVKYLDTQFIEDGVRYPSGDKWIYEEDPAEYARIEGTEIVFPITGWNYRMIIIDKR